MKTALADVERMLDDHEGLDGIEDYIEGRIDLPHEAKSALWLLAWGEVGRTERRHAVGELFEGFG